MCTISIDIQTRNDLYFAITNNILTMKQKEFTVDDVMIHLAEHHNITEEKVPVAEGNLRKSVEICIQNLIEHGKVIEEPRYYILKELID